MLHIANRNITQTWGVDMSYTWHSLLIFSAIKKVDVCFSSFHLASHVVRKLRSESRASCSRHANSHSYLISGKTRPWCIAPRAWAAPQGFCRVGLATVAYWSESSRKEQLMSITVYFEIFYWELAEIVVLLSVKALYGNRSKKNYEM